MKLLGIRISLSFIYLFIYLFIYFVLSSTYDTNFSAPGFDTLSTYKFVSQMM